MITITYLGYTFELSILADDRIMLGGVAIFNDWDHMYSTLGGAR